MRVRVTVVVEVETDVWAEAEEIGRQVERVCVGALDAAGLAPVSGGYGYEVVDGPSSHPGR